MYSVYMELKNQVLSADKVKNLKFRFEYLHDSIFENT